VSDPSTLRSFFLRLTGGGREQNPPWRGIEGETFEGTALEALIRLEALGSEAICTGPGIGKLPRGTRNAFGDRVSTRRGGSVADTVVLAGGMALAGRRVSVFVPYSAGLSTRVRGLADKKVPIVVFAIVGDEDDLEALGVAKVPLAIARDAAQAFDLALVVRRLAESALTPGIVVIEPRVAAAKGSWRLPPEGLVREYLGSPADLVEPPTAAQRILFDETRRRVPRWFDPDRPVLVGAAIPDELRASEEAGRRLFFGAGRAALLDAARAAFSGACGRDVPSIAMPGAKEAKPVEVPGRVSLSPRREALLQRIRRDVPESEGAVVAVAGGSAPPAVPFVEGTPPLAVRRFGKLGSTYDNVARFWGENAEPLLRRDPMAAAPDPYLALGAIPPFTAAFLPSTPVPETIPVLDPERCTACGRCWTACPDAAIPAVAAGTVDLLEAASRLAAAETESGAAAIGRLGRTFKPVAQRADKTLERSGTRRLDPAVLRESWAAFAEKGLSDPAEREALGVAFERVVSRLDEVPLVAAPGLGALLIAFDPRSCRGCGTCAAECPESAITIVPRDAGREREAAAAARLWEEIPDTPGSVVHRAEGDAKLGPLAAALLTRHAAFAVAGGGEGEAGSGTRLAARQVLAVLEAERQKATAARLEDLARLEETLRSKIREAMADAVTPSDLGTLEVALRGAAARTSSTAEILARLESTGERHAVDGEYLRRLAASALDVATLRRLLVEGEHGTGRARFGLVVVRAGLGWACLWPANPFGVPATVESAATAPTAAVGLAETLAARAVEEARIVRRARLVLEKPADLPARERALDDLSWPGLEDAEAAACAPVLVLAARSGIHPASLDGMLRALDCGLPVKVALLDDGRPLDPGGDPVLPALARRAGFVASTSVSEGAHLAEAVAAAVRARVPAFVRVLAPAPKAHGFAPDATVSRAREAVRARVAPLVRYDPATGEGFAGRLRLDGNPDPEATWATGEDGAAWTPSRWEEEPRNAEAVDREVAERWRTLREWAGAASRPAEAPPVEVKIVEVPVPTPSLDASWLRERLLALAGYRKGDRS
jgi:ferredoxin